MRLVVADTSPLFYLLSIDHIDLLPRLFGKVFVPDAVTRIYATRRRQRWSVIERLVFLPG